MEISRGRIEEEEEEEEEYEYDWEEDMVCGFVAVFFLVFKNTSHTLLFEYQFFSLRRQKV